MDARGKFKKLPKSKNMLWIMQKKVVRDVCHFKFVMPTHPSRLFPAYFTACFYFLGFAFCRDIISWPDFTQRNFARDCVSLRLDFPKFSLRDHIAQFRERKCLVMSRLSFLVEQKWIQEENAARFDRKNYKILTWRQLRLKFWIKCSC